MTRRITVACSLVLAISACTTATQTAATPATVACALTGDISSEMRVRPSASRCADADLSARKLSDITARRGRFQNADFTGATLIDVDMRGSNLEGADFSEATLTRVDWEDANLAGVDLEGAKIADLAISGALRCKTVRANGTVDNASCPSLEETGREAHPGASRDPRPRATGVTVSVDAFSVNGGRAVDCGGGGVQVISTGWTTTGDVQNVLIDIDAGNVAGGLAPNGNTRVAFDCAESTHSYDLTVVGVDAAPAGADNYVTVTTTVRAG